MGYPALMIPRCASVSVTWLYRWPTQSSTGACIGPRHRSRRQYHGRQQT